MNDAEAKRTVVINLACWVAAILAHPVSRLFPGESGVTPKIFEFLVPLFMLGLAVGSTRLLIGALRAAKK